jgi:hypothetical protein
MLSRMVMADFGAQDRDGVIRGSFVGAGRRAD